jgi:hypothetical protein
MRHEDALPRLPELVGLRKAVDGDSGLEAHVRECERCRARLDELRAIDARLRAMDEPPRPSAGLERRVLAIPGGTGAAREGPRRNRALAVAAVVVAVMAAAALGLILTGGDSTDRSEFQAERVVTLSTPRSDAAAVQLEVGDPGEGGVPVRLIATGLPHGEGRFYGLWLSGAQGAVSAGSFRPDGAGRCIVMLRMPDGDWSSVAITDDDQPPSTATTVASGSL